jgi:hypothetical protein
MVPNKRQRSPLYLHRYNCRQPQGSLAKQPAAAQLNNLVRNYT